MKLRKTINGTLVEMVHHLGLDMWLCKPVRNGGFTVVHIEDLQP